MGKIPRVYPNFSEILNAQLGDETFDPAAALEAGNEEVGVPLGEGVDRPEEDLAVDETIDRDIDSLLKKKKRKHKSSKKATVDSTETKDVGTEDVETEISPKDPSSVGGNEVAQVDGIVTLPKENPVVGEQTNPSSVKRKRLIDDSSKGPAEKDSRKVSQQPAGLSKEAIPPSSRNLPWGGSGPPAKKPPLAATERWDFRHKKDTPFVNDTGSCAELSCNIRGSAREMPEIRDLAFPAKFAESAHADAVASARKNQLVLDYELAMRKMAFDLSKAEAEIKANDAELEKARRNASEKAKEVAVERVRNQRERKQAAERANGLEEDLENARTRIAKLEREKIEEAEEHKKMIGFMKQTRTREVTSERGRLMVAAAARFDKFWKYMADRDKLETKICLHCQALGTLQSLDVLESWGLQYKREVEEVDVEEITERDLSLSPPHSGSIQGLDQFGTNVGIVDSATAASLRSPSVDVGSAATGGETSSVALVAAVGTREDVPAELKDGPTEAPTQQSVGVPNNPGA
ncbi:unnamed protein product [Eruca vesicaria subsp. sativa]|uniref:Uncharacterized protein n=1 Tax=Eruca vesicaria subsp. sativa TaxID=29727 RepID=A0ABC8IVQ3_ERUVS|nr:unnamed protein product [Eruca vesicaria subsp. sativa]